jgi:hypothetical protein
MISSPRERLLLAGLLLAPLVTIYAVALLRWALR